MDQTNYTIVGWDRDTGMWYKGKSLGEVLRGIGAKKGHQVLLYLYACEANEIGMDRYGGCTVPAGTLKFRLHSPKDHGRWGMKPESTDEQH